MVAAESLPCLIRHVTVGSFHVVNSSPVFEVCVGDYSPTDITFIPQFVPCHGLGWLVWVDEQGFVEISIAASCSLMWSVQP